MGDRLTEAQIETAADVLRACGYAELADQLQDDLTAARKLLADLARTAVEWRAAHLAWIQSPPDSDEPGRRMLRAGREWREAEDAVIAEAERIEAGNVSGHGGPIGGDRG